jgi:hypothetical protein
MILRTYSTRISGLTRESFRVHGHRFPATPCAIAMRIDSAR